MRIEVKCQPVCKDCFGQGRIANPKSSRIQGQMMDIGSECKSCNGKGYTEETMEFEWESSMNTSEGESWFYESNTKNPVNLQNYRMKVYSDFRIIFLDSKITESLNPQSIHIIEEKECPICVEYENTFKPEADYDDKFGLNNALESIEHQESCTDGKIKETRFWGVFGKSQEEYDAEKIKEGRNSFLNDLSLIVLGDWDMNNKIELLSRFVDINELCKKELKKEE